MCYERTQKEMSDLTRRRGGLVSYFGTNDARIVEDKANNGDEKAKLVLEAMAYQIAKTVGELATVVNGDRKSTRLNSSHVAISYAVFCLKKKKRSIARRLVLKT